MLFAEILVWIKFADNYWANIGSNIGKISKVGSNHMALNLLKTCGNYNIVVSVSVMLNSAQKFSKIQIIQIILIFKIVINSIISQSFKFILWRSNVNCFQFQYSFAFSRQNM